MKPDQTDPSLLYPLPRFTKSNRVEGRKEGGRGRRVCKTRYCQSAAEPNMAVKNTCLNDRYLDSLRS